MPRRGPAPLPARVAQCKERTKMDNHNADVARAQSFLADVPESTAPSRPRPITKEELTTAHHVKMNNNFKPLTGLAGTMNYVRGQAEELAQTIYLHIDDTTDDGADVEPALADTYRALTRAAQLLFEAQTHMYRYINRLENERLYNDELMAEHGNPA